MLHQVYIVGLLGARIIAVKANFLNNHSMVMRCLPYQQKHEQRQRKVFMRDARPHGAAR